MIKCIIVEDELLAREKLEFYVDRHNDLDLVASYASAEEFLLKSQNLEYQLLLLDIGLPNIDGISLVEKLPEGCSVVFTTAYSEYAVEAFNINVTDYLLKPFNFDRFSKAIEKVNSVRDEVESLNKINKKILVKEGTKIHRLSADDILYLKSLKEYVMWHTAKGRIMSLQSLSHLREYLEPYGFIQTHKSYIVNVEKVSLIEYGFVHLNKIQIPIGRSYREQVKKRFK